jgi:hypothetical protein
MHRVLLSLIALSSVAMAGTASAAQLIVNGGFENGTFTPSGSAPKYDVITSGGTQDLTGWTVGNSLAWGLGATDINTHSGSGFVDFTGLGDTAPHGSISQALATTVGQQYIFSIFTTFDINTTPRITVTVDGVTLVLTGTPGVWDETPSGAIWGQLTGTFTATNASSLLTIAGQPGSSFMIGIDDVSVTGPDVAGVPEPASWMMMLIGFGGIGFSMRHIRGKRLKTA